MNLLTSSLLLPEQTSPPGGQPHPLVLRSPVNPKKKKKNETNPIVLKLKSSCSLFIWVLFWLMNNMFSSVRELYSQRSWHEQLYGDGGTYACISRSGSCGEPFWLLDGAPSGHEGNQRAERNPSSRRLAEPVVAPHRSGCMVKEY